MATQDPTANYSWDLPAVGGSSGTWGTELNTIIGDTTTGIDAIVKAVSVVANAAVPKAGGTMTGDLVILTENYTTVNSGNLTGAIAFDLDTANCFYGTVTGAISGITFSNVPTSGKACFFSIEITNGGSQTIAWPSAVKWPGGTTPTLTTSGVDILVFYTRDGGTTIYGSMCMEDSS